MKKKIKKTLKRFTLETAMAFELQWNEADHPHGYLSRGTMYLTALLNGFWVMNLIGNFIESFLDELIHNEKEHGRKEGLLDFLLCKVYDGNLIICTHRGHELYRRELAREFPADCEFCVVFEVCNYTIMLPEEYYEPEDLPF
jgi:hypothetical protein